jgi:hypothetical protein
MELLIILIYAAILGLAAPYVNVRSLDYGQLVPSAIALSAGAVVWTILLWSNLGATNALTWILVMVAMPVAMAIGANRLAKRRALADAQLLANIKSSKPETKDAAAKPANDTLNDDDFVVIVS